MPATIQSPPPAESCVTPKLPSPAERPEADIVLYDGQCNFCRARVRQVAWWDCQGKLAYLSLHDAMVSERWPDIAHDRLMQEMCLIERQSSKHPGRRHWGAGAVRYLSLRLRRLWWLAPVMYFPGMMLLARPAYGLVSKYRYLIAGKTEDCESGTCSLHR